MYGTIEMPHLTNICSFFVSATACMYAHQRTIWNHRIQMVVYLVKHFLLACFLNKLNAALDTFSGKIYRNTWKIHSSTACARSKTAPHGYLWLVGCLRIRSGILYGQRFNDTSRELTEINMYWLNCGKRFAEDLHAAFRIRNDIKRITPVELSQLRHSMKAWRLVMKRSSSVHALNSPIPRNST